MLSNNAFGSRVLQGVFFAALFAVSGLASCGSGGGGSTSNNTTNTNTTTPTPTTGNIVLSLVPARTSGVAPLAVFFDASATTDTGVTTRPFHDLEYTWSFGDPSSGAWASGAQPGVSSRNSATGPVTAHVFETPGAYTVSLTAFDGTNTATTTTTITVQNPDTVFAGTNTICFSTSGTFTGCPIGATHVTTSNFVTAINNYQATSKRLLFRRGETFTSDATTNPTTAIIVNTGPGIVGAYGTGVAPVVQMTGDGAILGFSSVTTPTIKDWRVMDFEFDGLSKPNSSGIGAGGGFNQLTVLRVNAHDIDMGISINGGVLDYANAGGHPGHTLFEEIFVIESTFWRMYMFAKHFAILGSTLGNPLNNSAVGSLTHILRTPVIYKGVIANSTFSRNVGLAIKMHSPTWCDAGSPTGICANPNWCNPTNAANYPALCSGMSTTYGYTTNTPPIDAGGLAAGGYTEQVVVSDNKFDAGNGGYVVAIGPQNAISDERIRNVIVERNWFVSSASSETALVVKSRDVTVRNNITDMTSGGRFIRIQRDGDEPPANNVSVYNNTGYSAAIGGSDFIRIDGYSTNVTVQNNMAYSPNVSNPMTILLFDGFTAAGYYQSNNSTNAQMKSTNPNWVTSAPTSPADFRLTAGSYGLNTGAVVKVFSDFFHNLRPQGGAYDIGAVEGH